MLKFEYKNIKDFWIKEINEEKVKRNFEKYEFIKKIYDINVLLEYKESFSIHPLVIWLFSEGEYTELALEKLNNIIKEFIDINGFSNKYIDEKAKKFKNNLKNVEQFWSFLSELEVAYYFYKREYTIYFTNEESKTKTPDLKVAKNNQEINIEVKSIIKDFYYCEYELNQIIIFFNNKLADICKYRLKIKRDYGFKKEKICINNIFLKIIETLNKNIQNDDFLKSENLQDINLYKSKELSIILCKFLSSTSCDIGDISKMLSVIYNEIKAKDSFSQLVNTNTKNYVFINVSLCVDLQLPMNQQVMIELPSHINGIIFFANGICDNLDFKKNAKVVLNNSKLEDTLFL